MKLIKTLVVAFLAFGFLTSAVADQVTEVSEDTNLVELAETAQVSHVILSYKGEPHCVADTIKYPSLVPAFWEVQQEREHFFSNMKKEFQSRGHSETEDVVKHDKTRSELPECGVEEMNHIYKIAQNSVLVDDPNEGVAVAAAGPWPFVAICTASMAMGFGIRTLLSIFEIPAFKSLVAVGSGLLLLQYIHIHLLGKAGWFNSRSLFFLTGAVTIACGTIGGISANYLIRWSNKTLTESAVKNEISETLSD